MREACEYPHIPQPFGYVVLASFVHAGLTITMRCALCCNCLSDTVKQKSHPHRKRMHQQKLAELLKCGGVVLKRRTFKCNDSSIKGWMCTHMQMVFSEDLGVSYLDQVRVSVYAF